MTDMADATTMPMPKRRWLRYSLRTMLVFVLLLSVWLGWMANQAAKQRRAVELVHELGGSVVYECDVADDGPTLGLLPTGSFIEVTIDALEVTDEPASEGFFIDLIGHDWFHNVIQGDIASSVVTTKQLATIADGLPNIVGLHLYKGSIGDTELDLIASLERLEVVTIGGETHVTADGLARLRRRRPDLQVIWLDTDSPAVTAKTE